MKKSYGRLFPTSEETHRTCVKCGEHKEIGAFGEYSTRGVRRHRRSCKQCRCNEIKRRYAENPQVRQEHKKAARRSYLLKAYGLGEVEYSKLKADNPTCPICYSSDEELHVDHDHVTGRVRGLLCSSCNKGIGLFYDNPVSMLSAVEYLTQRSQPCVDFVRWLKKRSEEISGAPTEEEFAEMCSRLREAREASEQRLR